MKFPDRRKFLHLAAGAAALPATAACPLAARAAELSISTMPAESSPSTPDFFLALRPPKLSRRSAHHVTKMACQMTLVRKAGGICNFG